jgi:hypothetical protein
MKINLSFDYSCSNSSKVNVLTLTITKIMKRFYLVLSMLFFVASLDAQITVSGRTIDSQTGESLAFVAVFAKGTQNGGYSDIDGYFTLNNINQGATIVFHYVGYEPMEIVWSDSGPRTVRLISIQKTLAEVVIRPGENPAERIINRAIENRDKNNPERSFGFTYDSYNKLFFDLVPDTATEGWKKMQQDAEAVRDFKQLEKMHMFLIETVSQRKFLPPNNSEEKIVATRVSGLQNPDFALLGTQLQSFSFYGDYVEILSAKYLSPLTKGSPKKYLFIIEDTTYINADTVFTISFRPRKGKNFEGMKGQLFINTDGYAIQNVIAEPNEKAGDFSIRIQQQYQKIDDKAWFPVQLNSFLQIPINVDGFDTFGEGRSYMQNIQLNPPLRARDFTPVTMMMDKNAFNQPDSLWRKYRPYELDTLDLETYRTIDSIGRAENLDARLNVLTSLASGRIPMGPVDFDLMKLLRFNDYEGLRLGAGLRTNDKVSPYYSIGGYWAYGFKDKRQKFGGDLQLNLYRKRDAWLKLIYENDVREVGGNQIERPQRGLLLANIYPIFVNRMDRYEKYEVQLNGRAVRNFTLNAFANQQRVSPYQDISFNTALTTDVATTSIRQTQFDLFEVGGTLRWAPGEKLVRMKQKEMRLFGRYPVIWLKFTQGFDNVGTGDFNYQRFDAMVEKTFLIKNLGTTALRLIVGKVINPVPFTLLYNARGTYDNFGVFSPDAFETVRTNEFQHSEFAMFQFRHSFKDLLFKRENFRPQLVLVHNMMIGKLAKEQTERYDFEPQAASLGYYESGFQIDRLVVSNLSGLGIGVFYRYGPYSMDGTKDNLAIKITSVLNF